jgi:hypothetical protein
VSKLTDTIQRLGGLEPSPASQFHPVEPDELESIRARAGGTLPPNYEELLRDFGGGLFTEYVVCRTPDRTYPFSHFLGSVTGWGNDSLLRRLELYGDRIADFLLPFAYDGGGNLYCLGTGGSETGRVYYWDHEREPPAPRRVRGGLRSSHAAQRIA